MNEKPWAVMIETYQDRYIATDHRKADAIAILESVGANNIWITPDAPSEIIDLCHIRVAPRGGEVLEVKTGAPAGYQRRIDRLTAKIYKLETQKNGE